MGVIFDAGGILTPKEIRRILAGNSSKPKSEIKEKVPYTTIDGSYYF